MSGISRACSDRRVRFKEQVITLRPNFVTIKRTLSFVKTYPNSCTMKLIILAVAATLQWKLATSLAVERRDDPHDRGTWHLNCDKAGGACNNACWSIICLQQDTRKMYYDPGNNNEDNRIASGCDAGGSVCNTMPFSQKLNDPQKLTKPSCDEWPMAETKQDQKSNPNVLRCIDQSENSCEYQSTKNFPDTAKSVQSGWCATT